MFLSCTFAKAGEMTPKCFCKDERGDLALCICQTESQLLDSGAESNSWGKKKRKIVSTVFIGQRIRGLKQSDMRRKFKPGAKLHINKKMSCK